MRHGYILERTKRDPNEIIIKEDCAIIKLYDTKGNVKGETIIDVEDVELVKSYKFYLSKGYVRYTDNGKKKYLHRLVLHADTSVDHINHNTLDNRKSNLRIVTQQQNVMNIDKGLYKGVRQKPSGRYSAKIFKNYKSINIGTFDTKEEALLARHLAEIELFGDNRNKIYDEQKEQIFREHNLI